MMGLISEQCMTRTAYVCTKLMSSVYWHVEGTSGKLSSGLWNMGRMWALSNLIKNYQYNCVFFFSLCLS